MDSFTDPILVADSFHAEVAAVDARAASLLDDPVVLSAALLAACFHGDQVDKADRPYMEHVEYVASRVARLPKATSALVAAAYLHDTIEDTNLTLAEVNEVFGEGIAAIVDTLTRRPSENYRSYIRRVALNKEARSIKLVDNQHNMSRIAALIALNPEQGKSLLKRYMTARVILLSDSPQNSCQETC